MAADTKYVILQEKDTGVWLTFTDRVVASSARAAVLAALKDAHLGDKPATFVAVPERSWKPVTVKATQTITLKVDEPEPS